MGEDLQLDSLNSFVMTPDSMTASGILSEKSLGFLNFKTPKVSTDEVTRFPVLPSRLPFRHEGADALVGITGALHGPPLLLLERGLYSCG